MAKLDLRVRLLGKVLKNFSVANKSRKRILAEQKITISHNPLTDWWMSGLAPDVDVREGTADGADGRIPARIYRPQEAEGPLPLVVFIHGGGWTFGTLNVYDGIASTIARDANAVVVSLAYRLAPTHPWPAAAEDCYAALADVAGRAAEWNADGARLAVVGDSAGGNLAAVLTLMSRDRSGPAIAFQALLYPSTDLTLSSASMEEEANAPLLTKRDMERYRSLYLPHKEDYAHPYASPLLALDHSGLPPALIQVAEHDPLRDDGLNYARALRAAGVPVRITTYVGMPHGYLGFPRLFRSAPQALAELCAELRSRLGPAPAP
ncbi:alpha/beta hydrolase fold domain-containing protein [Arthrobacter yangruifuii]|uniref:Alpha/beta hydrolase fold domain-containing protein n=1 Tax=Arthrobacter yangruifuii TaxID=2606616 RepID=A0A5N6MSN6_9MICC|nr:alpha/beta hydrolase [Arthrobacter yangruifuii]KAD4059886.1 alpha/beta hydrolase fold domain-containing protein [Arthrobacter yangruifuii]